MPGAKLNYPFLIWTGDFIAKDEKQLFAEKPYIEQGRFNGAKIIESTGTGYEILSSSVGRIYFDHVLAIFDLIFPSARNYTVELELSEPEQLDLEQTKLDIVEFIIKNRWHHTGQVDNSEELLAPIRDAQSFAELVSKFDYVFGK